MVITTSRTGLTILSRPVEHVIQCHSCVGGPGVRANELKFMAWAWIRVQGLTPGRKAVGFMALENLRVGAVQKFRAKLGGECGGKLQTGSKTFASSFWITFQVLRASIIPTVNWPVPTRSTLDLGLNRKSKPTHKSPFSRPRSFTLRLESLSSEASRNLSFVHRARVAVVAVHEDLFPLTSQALL